jgi:transcriptional regulator with XRE-family HTH domain
VTVGDEIKRGRTEQGLSLNGLARLSGVAKGYLSQLENNQAPRPSATTLYKIAEALGTSVAELLGDDEPQSPEPPPLKILPSLQQFLDEQEERGQPLPDAVKRMLAGINYRGKAPKTADDWRYIYESIRMRIDGR